MAVRSVEATKKEKKNDCDLNCVYPFLSSNMKKNLQDV